MNRATRHTTCKSSSRDFQPSQHLNAPKTPPEWRLLSALLILKSREIASLAEGRQFAVKRAISRLRQDLLPLDLHRGAWTFSAKF
jgi:hypothetical protein